MTTLADTDDRFNDHDQAKVIITIAELRKILNPSGITVKGQDSQILDVDEKEILQRALITMGTGIFGENSKAQILDTQILFCNGPSEKDPLGTVTLYGNGVQKVIDGLAPFIH